MILADGTLGLVFLGVWLFCIIDVITTPEPRNLPKIAWLLIVVLLIDIGSIAWLVAGRNWQGHGAPKSATDRAYPQYDRPGRHVPANPDDDDAFLRHVRDRAEAQRRDYQERRKRELQDESDRLRKRPDPDETA